MKTERTFETSECSEEQFSLLLHDLHHWQKFRREPLKAISFVATIGHHVQVYEPELEFALSLIEARENMYGSGIYLPVLRDEYHDFTQRVLHESYKSGYVRYKSRELIFLQEDGFVANTICGNYQICLSNEARVELISDWLDR